MCFTLLPKKLLCKVEPDHQACISGGSREGCRYERGAGVVLEEDLAAQAGAELVVACKVNIELALS